MTFGSNWLTAAAKAGLAVLAEVKGRIVGYARSVRGRDGETGTHASARDRELHLLYVDGTHRGTGLARVLVERVLPGDEPAELWVVERNVRAVAFYRRLGFREDGERQDLGAVESAVAGLVEVRMVR